MMNEGHRNEWNSWVEIAAEDDGPSRCILRSDTLLAANAELTALRQQRDELLAAAKAARDMILTDRTGLADCSVGWDGTFDHDSAAALADYDAVLSQINAAIAKVEGCTKTPAQAIPVLTGVAARKLASLIEQGYRINGVAIRREQPGLIPKQGFVTDAGLVGWWPSDKEGNTP